MAHAALDVSDGLLADLGHVLKASGCGAVIEAAALPASTALSGLSDSRRLDWQLSGGDDYELCFTAPVTKRADVESAMHESSTPVSRIGIIESTPGLRLRAADGSTAEVEPRGYRHFSGQGRPA